MPEYSARIEGIGMFVPKRVLTNDDIAKMVDTTDEWIFTHTGIRERHIASEDQAASDLSVPAALEAIKDSGLKPEDIDIIIIAVQLPDHFCPSTAAIVQGKIGAVNAAAFDLNCGCQGFVHALAVGHKFIADGSCKHALVIGTCIHSKMIDWKERTVCIFFGDGSGAVVLSRCAKGEGIISVDLGCDGKRSDILRIPAGGSRLALNHAILDDRIARYGPKMPGKEILNFALDIIPKTINRALVKGGLSIEAIDFVAMHQANINIIREGLKRCGIPFEKTYSNLDRYGNMAEASIPVVLYEARNKEIIHRDDLVALTSFGVGLGWGTIMIRW